MKANSLSIPVLLVFMILGSSVAYCQGGSCTGHEVLPICTGDFICHFENEYCGTASGTIGFCTGSWGQGICTEGAGYVDLGDDDFYSSQMIEIECQVIFTQLPDKAKGDHAAGLVTKYKNHLPGESEWGLFVEGSFTEQSWYWELCGDGTQCISSSVGVGLNTLYCVRAWICRNGYGEIWINGVKVASGTIAINPANTATPVRIGNSASGENYFHGMIDEVRIGCVNTIGVEQSTWGSIKSLYR